MNVKNPEKKKALPGWMKTSLFILEIAIVGALLILWLAFQEIRESKSLWVLFAYCFPSEFLIAVVPHEPVILYFAKFYAPLTVALVTAAGTLLTETLNYSVFQYVADLKVFQTFRERKSVRKVVALFNKAPFFAIWIAALTPIPFYPFRFLVVLARYPLAKYLLALSLSRTPRFFLLALAGHAIPIPDSVLIGLFILLIVGMNLPLLRKYLKKKKEKPGAPDPKEE